MEASGRFGTQAPTSSPSSASGSESSSGFSEIERSDSGTASRVGGEGAEGGSASSRLASDRGETTIADGVVAKVVGIAAREVQGVYAMGGAPSRAIGSVTQRVGIGDERTQGVNVEVGTREAAADLTLVVEYGESIPTVATEVRENVIRRVEGICGLDVTEVNIAVVDMHFPGDEDPSRVE